MWTNEITRSRRLGLGLGCMLFLLAGCTTSTTDAGGHEVDESASQLVSSGGSGGSSGSGGVAGASGQAGSGGISAATISPGQSSYAEGASIDALVSGLPGNDLDWVGLFVPGADVNTRVAYQYTHGVQSGTITFPGVAAGTYELRAYLNNSAELLASSAAFSVTAASVSVTPTQASFSAYQSIAVNVSGLPGNNHDWIGLFAPGADANTRIAWQYTNGVQSGSFSFPGQVIGNYEVRAYLNDSTKLLGSAAVSVAAAGVSFTPPAVTPAAYEPITVTISGLPGNQLDWVGLFDLGADVNTRLSWQYTGGKKSGDFTFSGVAKGTYEVRAYANNSTTLLGTSASIKVGSAAVAIKPASSNVAPYAPITVNVTGLPGNQLDWLGIFLPGADANTRLDWQYTGGKQSGDFTFAGLPEGKYEIRAYANNSEVELGSASSFQVVKSAVSIQSAQASYPAFQPITANVSGLPGNQLDWVGLFVPGADVNTRVAWQYTNGVTSGALAFPGAPQGTYELRVYANNSTQLLGSSSSFSVTSSAASVQPSKSTYLPGETVVANFSGMPGNQLDWIGVFVPGADANTRVAYQYINGLTSGSAGFPGVPAGTYEIRVYANNSTSLLSKSATFVVQ